MRLQAGVTETRTAAGTIRKRAILLGVLVVVFDQITKAWASANLIGSPMSVVGNLLRFEYAENTGAAFGMLRGAGAGVFLGLAAVAAIGIVSYAIYHTETGKEIVGLALVGAGALGNLIDRMTNSEEFLAGFVVDFIRLPNFPNFNIADSAITVGAVALLWAAWKADRLEADDAS